MLPANSNPRGLADLIMLCPAPGQLGGMVCVSAMISEELARRGVAVQHIHTTSSNGAEGLAAKLWRHVGSLASYAYCLARSGPAPVWIHTCSGFSFYHASVHVLLARLFRCPVILHIHGGRFMDFAASAGALGRLWIRRTLQASAVVVVLSEGWRRQIRGLAPLARTCVLENAINESPVLTHEKRTGASICRFGFLGRLDVEKGVLDLLRAASSLADAQIPFELTLAGPSGTAGDPQEVAGRAAKMGLANFVRVIGWVNEARKESFFAECDAYVHPSHFEGMPLSLLEAMGRGLPCIATRVGAIPEVITDGADGLLIAAKEPEALAQAMHRLARDEMLRTKMGAAARELVMRRFGREHFANRAMNILCRACSLKAGASVRRAPVRAAW